MFLALYFATEETPEVAVNDNEPALESGWYRLALERLADSKRRWNDAHTAALRGEPVR
jgi:hypothetical protein